MKRDLDDDLNTAQALGAVFVLIRECNNALTEGKLHEDNRQEILDWFALVDERLAIIPSDAEQSQVPRTTTRKSKLLLRSALKRGGIGISPNPIAYATKLLDLGILVEDTREGMKWRRK